jgi:SAM-dependent methyltransferase
MPILDKLKRLRRPLKSRDSLHEYWTDPQEPGNLATDYIEAPGRSEYLIGLFRDHFEPPASVLEVGCNVGRNLHYALEAGYDAGGIEISEKAIEEMRSAYPDVAERATLHVGPVEEIIKTLPDDSEDAVFTLAVLEHIHPDSEWIFAEMVRVAKRYIVVIEDEVEYTPRHTPRNYKDVFESLGARQVFESHGDVPEVGPNYVARVFAIG